MKRDPYTQVAYIILEKEHGFKLILHQRDFMPGAIIMQNIAESVQKTRRMIMLLSRFIIENTEHKMIAILRQKAQLSLSFIPSKCPISQFSWLQQWIFYVFALSVWVSVFWLSIYGCHDAAVPLWITLLKNERITDIRSVYYGTLFYSSWNVYSLPSRKYPRNFHLRFVNFDHGSAYLLVFHSVNLFNHF